MVKKVLAYKNGTLVFLEDVNSIEDCAKKLDLFFKKNKSSLKQELDSFSIRIYLVEIDNKNKIVGKITKVKGDKLQDKETAVRWNFKGIYNKSIQVNLELIDNSDIVYIFWDLIEYFLQKKSKDLIEKLEFSLSVNPKKEGYTEKQKLILFFSKKENCKMWSYNELREAMSKANLTMSGRGIEGERPREFRYALGYPFITNEVDKKVPDGSVYVPYPFPILPRNERRNANVDLDKKNWSELLEILNKNPILLRCFECGRFEGETHRIGTKTKFEKGHIQGHLAGGSSSKENIFALCKQCNSDQKDIYSYDMKTGKKIWHIIPFIKNRDNKEKIEVLKFLLQHLKKEDIEKVLGKKL
jgi:5-methylcytosine-specific restriction endonuclease McrA